MPFVWVLLASVLFGTTGTARALGLPMADPLATGALRLAIGGLLLGVIALVPMLRRSDARPRLAAPLRRIAVPVLLGAAGVVAYQPTFFAGVRSDGVAVGTLVALGSAPVFTGLCAWLLSRRRPERRWFLCTGLAIVGVLLLSGLLDAGAGNALSPGGVAASLGAGLSYAVYTLAVKALLDLGWSTIGSVGAVFGVAGVVGAVELVAIGGAPLPDGRAVAAAVWLGAMTITLAYVLFARGLARLPAATVSTLTLAEPVVAGLLGIALLHERVTVAGAAGAALLVVALALLGRPQRSPEHPSPAHAA